MRDLFSVLEGYEGPLLSLPKAAKIIGVSRQWVHKEVVAGRIPAHRIGCYYKDASFSWAKKGAAVGPTRRGKGSKIMAIADRHGLPVACSIASASLHETKLVEATPEQRFTKAKPERMIGDRAYDSDPLDRCLREKHDIHLTFIAPVQPLSKSQARRS